MPGRLDAVAETSQFLRDAAALGLSEDEVTAIVDTIAADPLQGDEVQGSGGVPKGPGGRAWEGQERRLPSHGRLCGRTGPRIPPGPAEQGPTCELHRTTDRSHEERRDGD